MLLAQNYIHGLTVTCYLMALVIANTLAQPYGYPENYGIENIDNLSAFCPVADEADQEYSQPLYYPHPRSCQLFLECYQGKATVDACSPGLSFNPDLHECDHPDNFYCDLDDYNQNSDYGVLKFKTEANILRRNTMEELNNNNLNKEETLSSELKVQRGMQSDKRNSTDSLRNTGAFEAEDNLNTSDEPILSTTLNRETLLATTTDAEQMSQNSNDSIISTTLSLPEEPLATTASYDFITKNQKRRKRKKPKHSTAQPKTAAEATTVKMQTTNIEFKDVIDRNINKNSTDHLNTMEIIERTAKMKITNIDFEDTIDRTISKHSTVHLNALETTEMTTEEMQTTNIVFEDPAERNTSNHSTAHLNAIENTEETTKKMQATTNVFEDATDRNKSSHSTTHLNVIETTEKTIEKTQITNIVSEDPTERNISNYTTAHLNAIENTEGATKIMQTTNSVFEDATDRNKSNHSTTHLNVIETTERTTEKMQTTNVVFDDTRDRKVSRPKHSTVYPDATENSEATTKKMQAAKFSFENLTDQSTSNLHVKPVEDPLKDDVGHTSTLSVKPQIDGSGRRRRRKNNKTTFMAEKTTESISTQEYSNLPEKITSENPDMYSNVQDITEISLINTQTGHAEVSGETLNWTIFEDTTSTAKGIETTENAEEITTTKPPLKKRKKLRRKGQRVFKKATQTPDLTTTYGLLPEEAVDNFNQEKTKYKPEVLTTPPNIESVTTSNLQSKQGEEELDNIEHITTTKNKGFSIAEGLFEKSTEIVLQEFDEQIPKNENESLAKVKIGEPDVIANRLTTDLPKTYAENLNESVHNENRTVGEKIASNPEDQDKSAKSTSKYSTEGASFLANNRVGIESTTENNTQLSEGLRAGANFEKGEEKKQLGFEHHLEEKTLEEQTSKSSIIVKGSTTLKNIFDEEMDEVTTGNPESVRLNRNKAGERSFENEEQLLTANGSEQPTTSKNFPEAVDRSGLTLEEIAMLKELLKEPDVSSEKRNIDQSTTVKGSTMEETGGVEENLKKLEKNIQFTYKSENGTTAFSPIVLDSMSTLVTTESNFETEMETLNKLEKINQNTYKLENGTTVFSQIMQETTPIIITANLKTDKETNEERKLVPITANPSDLFSILSTEKFFVSSTTVPNIKAKKRRKHRKRRPFKTTTELTTSPEFIDSEDAAANIYSKNAEDNLNNNAEQDDQNCQNNTYLPHECNPSNYYLCRNGRKIRMKCADGLFFDWERSICTWPPHGSCQTYLSKDCNPTSVYLADKEDPTSFYQCANGRFYKFNCPKNLVFDKIKNVCNWPENVKDDYEAEEIYIPDIKSLWNDPTNKDNSWIPVSGAFPYPKLPYDEPKVIDNPNYPTMTKNGQIMDDANKKPRLKAENASKNASELVSSKRENFHENGYKNKSNYNDFSSHPFNMEESDVQVSVDTQSGAINIASNREDVMVHFKPSKNFVEQSANVNISKNLQGTLTVRTGISAKDHGTSIILKLKDKTD